LLLGLLESFLLFIEFRLHSRNGFLVRFCGWLSFLLLLLFLFGNHIPNVVSKDGTDCFVLRHKLPCLGIGQFGKSSLSLRRCGGRLFRFSTRSGRFLWTSLLLVGR